MEYHLAIDIGASSGRHILGYVEDGQLKIEEIYRFKNGISKVGDEYCWNLKALFLEIKNGIIIALTFVLPLDGTVFTRELWEMATECPVVFLSGIGVVPWMVPGGAEIGAATSELMKEHDIVIWAHRGTFCSGADLDLTFGLMDTVEKSAEILVKVLAMGGKKQTITPDNFRDLGEGFNIQLPEKYLY